MHFTSFYPKKQRRRIDFKASLFLPSCNYKVHFFKLLVCLFKKPLFVHLTTFYRFYAFLTLFYLSVSFTSCISSHSIILVFTLFKTFLCNKKSLESKSLGSINYTYLLSWLTTASIAISKSFLDTSIPFSLSDSIA